MLTILCCFDIILGQVISVQRQVKDKKQAGADLCQAQVKLGLFESQINLVWLREGFNKKNITNMEFSIMVRRVYYLLDLQKLAPPWGFI